MLQELKFQLSTAILTILTVAAAVSAGINFSQQFRFHLPDDGVTWIDHIEPDHIEPDHTGPQGVSAVQAFRVAPDSGADNGGVEFKTSVIIAAIPRDPAVIYQYLVGVAYLILGLFVYFRRGSAQKARHFYVFCLVSFIFSAFHYTGKLNTFDAIILFGNVAAGLLAPTLFLHFCLTFPEPRKWLRSKLRISLLYLPAAILMLIYLGSSSGTLHIDKPLVEVRETLDRIWLLFLTAMYLIGAVALSLEQGRAEDPVVRQQLKWLRNGAFSGILP